MVGERRLTFIAWKHDAHKLAGWSVASVSNSELGKHAIVELIPDLKTEALRYRYSIRRNCGTDGCAAKGTVRSDGRGQDPYLIHTVSGTEYRTKISTIRGDYRKEDGTNGNCLRLWEKSEFKPRPTDVFQERLYAVHWMRLKPKARNLTMSFAL